MVVCKKCALDTGTPGITINAGSGLCQFCESYKPLSEETREKSGEQMDTMFTSAPGPGPYDVIMALSGGIDSSYALYRLKKEYPQLRVLAVQFDNGFISETAFKNARKFCELTNSTYFHLALDNNQLQEAFGRAARSRDAFSDFAKFRASDICNTCMSIIKQKLIEMALRTKTPYIVFAFSPGQTEAAFVPLPRHFISWIRKLFDHQLKSMGVTARDQYLTDPQLIADSPKDAQVTIVHPYLVWDYNKAAFRQECLRIGWVEPAIDDPNSSNCLLNAFATKNHFDKYHIHSYALDLSSIVRQGTLTREEALKSLNTNFSDPSIEKVRQILLPEEQ